MKTTHKRRAHAACSLLFKINALCSHLHVLAYACEYILFHSVYAYALLCALLRGLLKRSSACALCSALRSFLCLDMLRLCLTWQLAIVEPN